MHALSADPNYARAYPDLSFTYWTAWFNHVDDRTFLDPKYWTKRIDWHERLLSLIQICLRHAHSLE